MREAPVARAAPPPPAQQVVTVIMPVLSAPEGSHRVALRLQPEDLGTIDATVEVRGGQVNVTLSAETAAGHRALASALPDLREQLGGATPANVFLSDPGGGGQTRQQALAPASPTFVPSGGEEPEPGRPASPGPPRSNSSIDLRL